jgi:hypothetical protein
LPKPRMSPKMILAATLDKAIHVDPCSRERSKSASWFPRRVHPTSAFTGEFVRDTPQSLSNFKNHNSRCCKNAGPLPSVSG